MEVVGPVWFLGIDAIAESVFFLVTLLVTVTALRAYGLLKDTRYRALAWGFGLLSAAYLTLALVNAFVAAQIRAGITTPLLAERLEDVLRLGVLGHCTIFLLGLLVLVTLYYDIRDWGVRGLLTALVLFCFALAGHDLTSSFYLLAAILLGGIILRLWRADVHRRRWLLSCGFTLVLIGDVLLGALFLTPLLYVAGHFTTLAGYLLLLTSNLRALRR